MPTPPSPSPELRTAWQPLILFGGTFDPIHQAHVRAALAVSAVLGDAEVRLLPNAVPPHRPQPMADGAHRLAMVRHACHGHPTLQADAWELSQAGPSHTLTTLRHYRRLIGAHRPLVLLIGGDSFAGLAGWYRWREFAALCHLAVVPRPGAPMPSLAVQQAFRQAPARLLRCAPAGRRLMLDQPRLNTAATDIRRRLAGDRHCPALPTAVEAYIRHHGLYTDSIHTRTPAQATHYSDDEAYEL